MSPTLSDLTQAMDLARPSKRLLIEGWRGINHSFALVNQYQILQLLDFKGLSLFHQDMPFAFKHWNRTSNGSGLSDADLARIDALGDPGPDAVDCVYRIFSPYQRIAPKDRRRTTTFMITEMGLSRASFVKGSDRAEHFTRNDNTIVTGSNWARERLVEWGFAAEKVRVIAHGVDPVAFRPLLPAERETSRQALGIRDDEIVFMNIGAPIWNKGLDLVLIAYAKLKASGLPIRLILKSQQDVYGLSLDDMVRHVGAMCPELLRADVLGAISVVATNMPRNDLRLLYGIADCYVSPYRAEGFNLPVLEAIACGTPVIVTRGGATDDFCTDDVALRIGGTIGTHEDAEKAYVGRFIEPDTNELIAAMDSFVTHRTRTFPNFDQGRRLLVAKFSWTRAAAALADHVVGVDGFSTTNGVAPIRLAAPAVSQADILALIAVIQPQAMTGVKKVRVGNNYDGGYVLPEGALNCDSVLSIGVGPDVSFDLALAKRGAKVLQFDHTVEKSPVTHEKFTFEKLGWGIRTEDALLSFDDIIERFALLGGTRSLFKFDIEGNEYDVLDAVDPERFLQFEIIVCEIHDLDKLADPDFYQRARRSLEKLTRHHAPVHLHANNYGGATIVAGVMLPSVLEISFLRRDLDRFDPTCRQAIPGPLDRPNHPYIPDICLTAF